MTSTFRRAGRKGHTVQYVDPVTGRTRMKSFPTKAAADDFGDEIRRRARVAAGMAHDRRFEEYAQEWLAAAGTALKRTSLIGYEADLRNHLLPAFGHLWLRELTMPRVKAFVVEKRQALAKKTCSNLKGLLHTILEHAREDGIVATNAAAYRGKSKILRLTATRAEKKLRKAKAMEAEQARAFFAAAELDPEPVWHPCFYTLFAGALRLGEGLALEPKHVDFAGKKLLVEQAFTIHHDLESTKTGEEASIDLWDGAARVLRAWQLRRPASRWLFPKPDGERMDHFTAERAFRRIVKAAGLPSHFTPHCLRHTCATQLLLQGESVQYVQEHLRHASIQITVDTYGSWLPKGDPSCGQRLEARVFGGRTIAAERA